jgi:hypothetical protein
MLIEPFFSVTATSGFHGLSQAKALVLPSFLATNEKLPFIHDSVTALKVVGRVCLDTSARLRSNTGSRFSKRTLRYKATLAESWRMKHHSSINF